MNLENVQARPDALTKVSGFNPNNKIFPFIEHYHATEREVEALINKITYNSMTVGRIGTIADFIQSDKSFIKARLIRLEDLADDYHMSSEIAKEIEQGVFI